MLAVTAALLSILLIGALCLSCPKRRRTARLAPRFVPAEARPWLAATACLPGLFCLWVGDAAAFLIWLGACATTGWLVTLCANRRPDAA